jgi:hypothetical protein
MTTQDYYLDPGLPDSQIAAHHAGRAFAAGRLDLGHELGRIALNARLIELRREATSLPATPPPLYQEQIDHHTTWFDKVADDQPNEVPWSPAPPPYEPVDQADGDPPREPGTRPVVTAKCIGPAIRDGMQVECRGGVWFKPGEDGRPATWVHIDPDHNIDHNPVVMPEIHDRAIAHETHLAGEDTA